MKYKIYYLFCKKTGIIIYVGCTSKSLKIRLGEHINHSKNKTGPNHVKNYIISLLNFDIGIKLIETVGYGKYEASQIETATIMKYYKNGHPITNSFRNRHNTPILETTRKHENESI